MNHQIQGLGGFCLNCRFYLRAWREGAKEEKWRPMIGNSPVVGWIFLYLKTLESIPQKGY